MGCNKIMSLISKKYPHKDRVNKERLKYSKEIQNLSDFRKI